MGDLLEKPVRGKVTGESAIKPEYTGDGVMVLEPTYKHIILLMWMTGMALWSWMTVCSWPVTPISGIKAVMRSTLSSAVAGNEGMFNLGIVGSEFSVWNLPVQKRNWWK